jgi:hypothetical protein
VRADGGLDASQRPDGDAGHDADAGEEADAPIFLDAAPDVFRSDCVSKDVTYIYVVTVTNQFLYFDPATTSFHSLGTLSCPSAVPNSTPFSMAVDRTGIAYVVYSSGELFRVHPSTLACELTPFVPGGQGFATMFGMGFSTDLGGPSEHLFVAESSATFPRLATIDTTTFNLNIIGPLQNSEMELTGTGDGRLYGYYTDTFGAGQPPGFGHILHLDKTSGSTIDQFDIPDMTVGSGWAFGFWGGDFWLFTAPTGTTQVTHFVPATGASSIVATLNDEVVGAGVSTCAPE